MKILSSEMHCDVIRMMRNNGILEHILPEIGEPAALDRLKRLETGAAGFESVRPDPIRRLASILDTDDEGFESVCRNLVLTNKEQRRLRALRHPGWRADPEVSEADFERVPAAPGPGDRPRSHSHRLGAEPGRGVWAAPRPCRQVAGADRRDRELGSQGVPAERP